MLRTLSVCYLIVFCWFPVLSRSFNLQHLRTCDSRSSHSSLLPILPLASKAASDFDPFSCDTVYLPLRNEDKIVGMNRLLKSVKVFGSAASVFAAILNQKSAAAEAADTNNDSSRDYVDVKNGFSIVIPVGFSSMPRKKAASDSLTTGVPVEILLVAQDFLKGASLSVGRSDVPQLLDDFSVPWAGKPINSIADVGTANIVSELLILQRQGAFGSVFFKTKLGVTAANDAELTNMDNNISEIVRSSLDAGNNLVMFEFKTPLSAGIRYTLATSRLKGKYLYTVWLSVLGPLYDTEYKQLLLAARDSFQLI